MRLNGLIIMSQWGYSWKDPHSPMKEMSEGGARNLFLIIPVEGVLWHPKGVGGLTSNFLCGGGNGCLLEWSNGTSNWRASIGSVSNVNKSCPLDGIRRI
jgi:hypothetical protein